MTVLHLDRGLLIRDLGVTRNCVLSADHIDSPERGAEGPEAATKPHWGRPPPELPSFSLRKRPFTNRTAEILTTPDRAIPEL